MPRRVVAHVPKILPNFQRKVWKVDEICLSRSSKYSGWYEARIVSIIKTRQSKQELKVHFQGWNSSLDEIVQHEDLLDYHEVLASLQPKYVKSLRTSKAARLVLVLDPDVNETNARDSQSDKSSDAKQIQKNTPSKRTKKKGKAEAAKSQQRRKRKVVASNKKRRRPHAKNAKQATNASQRVDSSDHSSDSESDDSTAALSVKKGFKRLQIKFPNSLNKQLISDWTLINKKHLVPLPRKLNVKEVVKRYVRVALMFNADTTCDQHWQSKQQKTRRLQQLHAAKDFATGLELYFDRALPRMLLYSFERLQYRDSLSRHKGMQPSEIYGAEHLLRLFVKLPDLVSLAGIPDEDVAPLSEITRDFLSFLNSQRTTFFRDSYAKPTPEYLEKSKLEVQQYSQLQQQKALAPEGKNE